MIPMVSGVMKPTLPSAGRIIIKRTKVRRKFQHERVKTENPRKRHGLCAGGRLLCADLKLPEEHRPIGHWGRLHQSYLKQFRPMVYSDLLLSGKLHTVLADLNEQATDRLNLMIRQMAEAEGVTEAMKAENQMLWVQSMNSIRSRAEEIIKHELIYS